MTIEPLGRAARMSSFCNFSFRFVQLVPYLDSHSLTPSDNFAASICLFPSPIYLNQIIWHASVKFQISS